MGDAAHIPNSNSQLPPTWFVPRRDDRIETATDRERCNRCNTIVSSYSNIFNSNDLCAKIRIISMIEILSPWKILLRIAHSTTPCSKAVASWQQEKTCSGKAVANKWNHRYSRIRTAGYFHKQQICLSLCSKIIFD